MRKKLPKGKTRCSGCGEVYSIKSLCEHIETESHLRKSKELKGVRPSVQWFAAMLETILDANDYKGGWDDETLDYLFCSLREEVKELGKKLPANGNVDLVKNPLAAIKECGDVGNFAMMIADIIQKRFKVWP